MRSMENITQEAEIEGAVAKPLNEKCFMLAMLQIPAQEFKYIPLLLINPYLSA